MLPLLWNGPGFVPCLLMLRLSMFSTWNAPLGTTKMPLIERLMFLPTHPRGSGSKTGTAAHIKLLTCLIVGWNLCYLHEPHQCSSWGRQVHPHEERFRHLRSLSSTSSRTYWQQHLVKLYDVLTEVSIAPHAERLKRPGKRGHCVMIVICGCFSPFTRFV